MAEAIWLTPAEPVGAALTRTMTDPMIQAFHNEKAILFLIALLVIVGSGFVFGWSHFLRRIR